MSNKLIIILGAPGSGKGTQTNLLLKNDKYQTLCMGDIVRNEIRNKTAFAITMQSYLDRGDLVPDKLISDLFLNFYNKKHINKHLILDGFPRTISQCHLLKETIKDEFNSIFVLFIDVPDNVLIDRLLQRKRSDDTKSVIQNRIKTFKKEIKPIKEYFSNELLYIKGDTKLEEIHQEIFKVIN